jgi:hypothetical protein
MSIKSKATQKICEDAIWVSFVFFRLLLALSVAGLDFVDDLAETVDCGDEAFAYHVLVDFFKLFVPALSQQLDQHLSHCLLVAGLGNRSGVVVWLARNVEGPDGTVGRGAEGHCRVQLFALLLTLQLLQSLDDLVSTVAHFDHLLCHLQLLSLCVDGSHSQSVFRGKPVSGNWLSEMGRSVAWREKCSSSLGSSRLGVRWLVAGCCLRRGSSLGNFEGLLEDLSILVFELLDSFLFSPYLFSQLKGALVVVLNESAGVKELVLV